MALKVALSFACLMLLPLVVSAQNTYTTYSNLSYVDDGNVSHKLDLYVPNGATSPVPLIVWIHGGGWQSGDVDGQHHEKCRAAFAARRYFNFTAVRRDDSVTNRETQTRAFAG